MMTDDIWRRLEKHQTVAELCASLAEDYRAAPAAIEQDVTRLLMSILGYELVKDQDSVPTH